jgi:hypothetical protein
MRWDLQVTCAVTLLFNGGEAELGTVVIGQLSPDITYVIGAGELSPVLLVLMEVMVDRPVMVNTDQPMNIIQPAAYATL